MPTIDRNGPFKVVIYFNDHEPCHVHVHHPSGVLIVDLHGPNGEPEAREVHGSMKTNELKRAFQLVVDNQDAYQQKWDEIHKGDLDE